jgi:hypothetical protein
MLSLEAMCADRHVELACPEKGLLNQQLFSGRFRKNKIEYKITV